MSRDDTPQEVRVECRNCRTTWIGFHLPMRVAEFVEASRALRCPLCSSPQGCIDILTPHELTTTGDKQ